MEHPLNYYLLGIFIFSIVGLFHNLIKDILKGETIVGIAVFILTPFIFYALGYAVYHIVSLLR